MGFVSSQVQYLKTYKQRKGANVGPPKTCKYIEGDKPYGPDPYCNLPCVHGFSYCRDHKFICYQIQDEKSAESFAKYVEYLARTSR